MDHKSWELVYTTRGSAVMIMIILCLFRVMADFLWIWLMMDFNITCDEDLNTTCDED